MFLGPMGLILVRFGRIIWSLLKNPESRGLVYLVAALLVSGTLFYHFVEGWKVLDALYFSVITLATVGYGDFSPKTDAGKVFTIIYIIVGLGTLAAFISLVAEQQRDGIAQRGARRAARKAGVQADAESGQAQGDEAPTEDQES